MKALYFIFSLLLANSSSFAMDTLDNQNKLKSKEGQEFLAIYEAHSFLAWTGQEEHFLSHSTLDKLANNRADDICKFFGYSSAKVSLSTVRSMNAPNEADYNVNYIQNGDLRVIDAGHGFLSHIVIPTVFTKLTCYL